MTTTGVSSSREYLKHRHPNSLANLVIGRARIAEKVRNGEPLNPDGYSLTADLKHRLKDKAKRDELVESLIEGAILREPTPLIQVLDRVDGKVADPTPQGNQDNRTINIFVSSEKAKELTEGVGKFGIFHRDD